MRSAGRFLFSSLVFLLAVSIHSVSAEEIQERLDGQVTMVDAEKRIVTIEFVHPATEKKTQKTFSILENAGFEHLEKLSDLKEGNLVTIDYYEHSNGSEAVYIARVLVDDPYVTHAELAGALVTLGKNKSNK